MACASVGDDNPRVSEGRLSPYRHTDHAVTSLLHLCASAYLQNALGLALTSFTNCLSNEAHKDRVTVLNSFLVLV